MKEDTSSMSDQGAKKIVLKNARDKKDVVLSDIITNLDIACFLKQNGQRLQG